jgi:hypothetical protein
MSSWIISQHEPRDDRINRVMHNQINSDGSLLFAKGAREILKDKYDHRHQKLPTSISLKWIIFI